MTSTFRRDPAVSRFDINYGMWKRGNHADQICSARMELSPCYGSSDIDSLKGNPPNVDGYTITSLHFGYVATLLRSLECQERIVEVGGGFGGFAESAYRVGARHITQVDFPAMIRLQEWYLEHLPESFGREFVAAGGPVGRCDAFVNMTSMCEMDPDQVAHYIAQATAAVRPGGVFVSVNHLKCVYGMRRWRMPEEWTIESNEPFPHVPGKRGNLRVYRRA